MNLSNFGMDSITLAGSLEAKLLASRAAGFSQILLWAKDLAGYPGGLDEAARLVRASGLRVTGLQVMRDFEGLSGTLHEYKLDIAKQMLQVCKAVGAPLLLVCSSTSSHASGEPELLARHLAKLATLAVPLGVRIGYEALSRGRHINQYVKRHLVHRVVRNLERLAVVAGHQVSNTVRKTALCWGLKPSIRPKLDSRSEYRLASLACRQFSSQ